MIIPNLYYDYNDNFEYYKNYFEIQSNGFFEYGNSHNFFHTYSSNKKVITHLTWTVGFAWILLNFARSFYAKINYFEEFIFQMSFLNVKDAVLGGFGKPSPDTNWPEPFDFIANSNPPVCMHDNFKIIEKMFINEMSEEYISKILFNIATNLSHAFGVLQVKCFDEKGNFNKDRMMNFTL
jgi:hypothetical protein